MKKKVVRYTESDIERLVERILNEDLPRRERERHATQFAKAAFDPYDREREIMDAFGPYRDDVPANVISYLRKNPRRFLQKLTNAYGIDKMLDFIGYEVPMVDEPMEEDYDNYMSDRPERPRIKQEPNPSDDDKEYWSRVPKQPWQPKQRPIVRQEKNPKL
jgi:hypothetical protein